MIAVGDIVAPIGNVIGLAEPATGIGPRFALVQFVGVARPMAFPVEHLVDAKTTTDRKSVV